jgi:hypothetical protein
MVTRVLKAFEYGPAAHLDQLAAVVDGVCTFRPRGEASLVELVDFVRATIAYARGHRFRKLLIDTTGLSGVPIPTLVDRFLVAEEWASEADGTVVVALVVEPRYIHPKKFGVKVARDLGLIIDVHTSEAEALDWLASSSKGD